jgi:hypothetical protein
VKDSSTANESQQVDNDQDCNVSPTNGETQETNSVQVHLTPDFLNLPELKPPNLMPGGNVGTSTKYFLQAIKDCRMSSKLIGKLKLDFPQTR